MREISADEVFKPEECLNALAALYEKYGFKMNAHILRLSR